MTTPKDPPLDLAQEDRGMSLVQGRHHNYKPLPQHHTSHGEVVHRCPMLESSSS